MERARHRASMATCRACGAQAPDDARACPTCGSALPAAAPGAIEEPGPTQPGPGPARPAPWPTAPGPLPRARARPLGVTILAILDGLGGVLGVILGLLLLVAGPVLGSDPEFQAALARELPEPFPQFAGELLAALGAILLVLGLVYLLLAWGLYQGRGWAWTLAMALVLLSLAWSVATLVFGDATGLVGVAIYGFLLWYFTRGGVKAWFGKVEAAQPGLPGYVPPPTPPT